MSDLYLYRPASLEKGARAMKKKVKGRFGGEKGMKVLCLSRLLRMKCEEKRSENIRC